MTKSPLQGKVGPLAVLLLQLVLLVVLGRFGAAMQGDNSIETFAVAGTRAEADYALLTSQFKAAEQFMVVVRFPPEADSQQQAEELLAQFGALPGISRHVTLASLFPDGIPAEYPATPLPFRKTAEGCYIGYFQPESGPLRAPTMLSVSQLQGALQAQGLDVILAGEPVVSVALDKASTELKFRFFPLLIVTSLLLLGGLFRDLKVLLISALAIGGSLATTTGIMALSGETMNLVTNLTPALIFVLATAMQVHVLVSIAARGDIHRGIRAKLRPNFLISLTTSIGFGSLMTSQVIPIATMGKYMALGIWVIFVWAHMVHYGLSVLLNFRPKMPRLNALMAPLQSPHYLRLLRVPFLTAIPLIVIVLGAWSLIVNPTESNGLRYFEKNHPLRVQTAFLEKYVTGSSQVEILIPAPVALDGEDAYFPETEQLPLLESGLAKLPHVRNLLSLNAMGQFSSACEESGTAANLDESMLEPFMSPQFYRIQLLVDSLNRDEYQRLRVAIENTLQAHQFSGNVRITGVLDRIIEIQRYLLSSLLKSLAITITAVVLLLLLLLGRKVRLLALFLPNLFPLACMAVLMHLLGIPTTISSVMVFSVAFGVAVDDTIHLLDAYQSHEGDHITRWQKTIGGDARAVALTTVVLTVGFGVLTTSSFLPTYHFGLLLGAGMLAALLGDLIFLPGLLNSRKEQQISP